MIFTCPSLVTGEDETKIYSYMEVGTKCSQYPGLAGDENTILVYSAIIAFAYNIDYESLRFEMNIPVENQENKVDIYLVEIQNIASFLNITCSEVEYSIKKLEKLKLIYILMNSSQSVCVKIMKDLRYVQSEYGNWYKKIYKVHDTIFRKMDNKKMALLYSFYLHQYKTTTPEKYINLKYRKATNTLGYSKKEIISKLDDLKNAGFIKIAGQPEYNIVIPLVDFSKWYVCRYG